MKKFKKFIPLAIIIFGALVIAAFMLLSEPYERIPQPPPPADKELDELLGLLNFQRTMKELEPFSRSAELDKAAKKYVDELVKKCGQNIPKSFIAAELGPDWEKAELFSVKTKKRNPADALEILLMEERAPKFFRDYAFAGLAMKWSGG